VRLSIFDFSPRVMFFISSALIFGVVVSPVPSKSFAQNEPAAHDNAQATPVPAPQPKPGVELPDGEGKAIATEFCQDCHRLADVARARKSASDWHDTVQTMMDRGARLPQDKFDTLVRYLAKNFGAQNTEHTAGTPSAAVSSSDSPAAAAAQAPKTVELPEGEGKAIATEYCQACHKLTNLTKAHKDRDDWHDTVQLMMDRGATIPENKVDTLVEYLAKNFGPKAAAPPSGTSSPDAPPAGSSPSSH